tara:strand:+ start:5142 stop:5390 length:249 start_codon:yes stop_codon:yes gene_type:complete
MKDLFGKFKEYKNILGKPGTGVHKLKFKGTSLFDYFLTIASAFVITYMSNIPLVWSTVILFIIGIVLHYLVGIKTMAIKVLD